MHRPEIYELLAREHEEIDELFHELLAAKGKLAAELLARVRLKLVPHSRAEEAVFYLRLQEDERTAEKVRVSLEEHKQVENLLGELVAMSPRDDNWAARARVLADMVGHHVDEEEGELFPLARRVLDPHEAQRLGAAFETERDRVWEYILGQQRGAA
ncbi:Hemerythrin HHE cation binding domain-containing protein [Nannocystis exedens]|uniref:Hemerythrin HHE cation binding domain-containing protein n=1 Tax=Nannocystis exedens TaxID=54 RepID=A0A1I1V0U2_9BACT|nr:hemerythrin domain-containing protein [Nannocystis exedens]PCC72119.1 DNA nickase [Nannocystis exedens]SFD74703.1 Hemerythrin HHE cation binding domain-containing protein [Nannocystis exedens]